MRYGGGIMNNLRDRFFWFWYSLSWVVVFALMIATDFFIAKECCICVV